MLKKTTLAVLGLAASGFASAGTMGPVCTPGNVTVPCEAKAWDLGIQALYLRPVFGAEKAYNFVNDNVYGEAKNDWNWAYRLEGSYHFNTGNDATLNWTHFSGDVNQAGFVGEVPLPPFFNVPFTVSGNSQFDQVNLVMGQHADFGLVKKMRFYGGLQYANIQATSSNLFPISIIPLQISSVSQFENSDFKGVGPVVGIDYSYNITNEFSITANGAGSILYGTTRLNTGYIFAPMGLVRQSIYGDTKSIVPSLEAKLGLNYAYSLAQGILNLEGGYQAMNYFSALQTQSLLGSITDSNYGLYGPYLGIKYVGYS